MCRFTLTLGYQPALVELLGMHTSALFWSQLWRQVAQHCLHLMVSESDLFGALQGLTL